MQITPQALTTLAQGFNAAFTQGLRAKAQNKWQMVAMRVPSTAALNNYGWMKDIPGMREWVGQRVVNNLEAQAYQIFNKKWEHTIGVKEDDIEDDNLGIYTPMFQMQGELVANHPDLLVFGALLAGYTTLAYDGQYFFDTDHVGYNDSGAEVAYSNVQSGAGESWFLMDLGSTFMKPLILQVRRDPRFMRKDKPTDDNAFMEGTFYYGADARYNAGHGFYQLAFASKADLNETNFKAARLAMESQRRIDGSPLGVTATHLVYGPSRQSEAEALINAQLTTGGASNTLYKAVALEKIQWLK
jgi:phage major head subunit gpT-like protein